MIKTTALGNTLCVLGLTALLGGCASEFKKTEATVKEMPVNCETAEGDLRQLQSEKANVAQQVGMGVTSIVPIGLVVGLVRGNAGTKFRVATGEYNKALDAKSAEIKETCSIS